jgi:hypothetical protein
LHCQPSRPSLHVCCHDTFPKVNINTQAICNRHLVHGPFGSSRAAARLEKGDGSERLSICFDRF